MSKILVSGVSVNGVRWRGISVCIYVYIYFTPNNMIQENTIKFLSENIPLIYQNINLNKMFT